MKYGLLKKSWLVPCFLSAFLIFPAVKQAKMQLQIIHLQHPVPENLEEVAET
ncbi:MAG: hypothetical protein ACMZ7B_01305 [Balneola sp.]